MSLEQPTQPTTLGIDLGGSGLRVATDYHGHPQIAAGRSSVSGLLRVISRQHPPDGRDGGWRVLSLKRMLDSGHVIRVEEEGGGEKRADAHVAALFRSVFKDDGIYNPDASPHVLGAVPPNYTQRHRSVFRNALTASGFARAKLVDDSLAALLACREQLEGRNSILVYSWGASTFCAALYRPAGSSFRAAIAPEGDHELGGDEINAALLRYVAARGGTADFSADPSAAFNETERVKLVLSAGKEAHTSLAAMGVRAGGAMPGKDDIRIPQELFVEIVDALFNETLELARKVLSSGNCPMPDAVLLVGGTTGIPRVRRELGRIFAGRLQEASPDAVALGAVMHGRMLPESEWEAAENRRNGPPGLTPGDDEHSRPARESEDRQVSPPDSGGTWSGALELEPLLARAEDFERSGRLDEAVRELETVHSRLGKFSCLVYYRAASKKMAAGEPDLAFPLLSRANRLDPAHRQTAWTYAQLCIRKSDAYLEHQKFREAWGYAYEAVTAIERLPHAESEHPGDVALCLHRQARLLSKLGRLEEAEKLLERCVRLDPQQTVYGEDLKRVRRLRLEPRRPEQGQPGGAGGKVGRNDPCPCGSGMKYKKCHGC